MQDASKNFLDALKGSFSPVAQVDAWYDGDLVFENLPVLSGSVTLDSTRAIMGSATIECGSPDGALIPSSWDSPLACYGSQLHVRAGVGLPNGPDMQSIGWFRIDSFDTQEWWKPYTAADGSEIWTPRGVKVQNQCSDLMSAIDDARFLAPEAPASLTSVIAEITRLCQSIVTVEDLSGITDAAIPKSFTYDQSRATTIQNLAAVVGCTASMSPDNGLQLVPIAPGATAWTISVNNDDQVARIMGWTRKGDRVGIYNAAVSTGTDAAGNPVQGVAFETHGPLYYGGPFGQVPYGHGNPQVVTDSAAFADASTTLANLATSQVVIIPIACPANTALRPNDVISIELPDRTIAGPAQSMTWSLMLPTMQINVAVPRSSLWS